MWYYLIKWFPTDCRTCAIWALNTMERGFWPLCWGLAWARRSRAGHGADAPDPGCTGMVRENVCNSVDNLYNNVKLLSLLCLCKMSLSLLKSWFYWQKLPVFGQNLSISHVRLWFYVLFYHFFWLLRGWNRGGSALYLPQRQGRWGRTALFQVPFAPWKQRWLQGLLQADMIRTMHPVQISCNTVFYEYVLLFLSSCRRHCGRTWRYPGQRLVHNYGISLILLCF